MSTLRRAGVATLRGVLPVSITALLDYARDIWGADPMSLPEIAVAMGVVHGDLCRVARDVTESGDCGRRDVETVSRELGNMILSCVRWADDLGLRPEDCVAMAMNAQRAYVARRRG